MREGERSETGSVALGKALAALRLARGLSLRELGRRIGKAASTVQAWEQGRRMPGLDDLMVLAHELGHDLDGLVRLAAGPRRQLERELAGVRRELRQLEGEAGGHPGRSRRAGPSWPAARPSWNGCWPPAGRIEAALPAGEADRPDPERLGLLPARRLPVAGEIAAGQPRFVLEEVSEFVHVPEGVEATYALHVVGDSMVGAGIEPGDLVLVRAQEAAEPGDVVVALLGGQEVTVKYLLRENGRYFLRAHNAERHYPDIPLGPEDRILGVVEHVLKRPGPPPREGARRMGEILIGTSGYSYKDWVGPFYPPGLPERQMLAFYAQRFPFTEVNATFYRLPPARTFEGMLRHVPAGFLFTIKAYRTLTHERETGSERDARLFREALRPLEEAGRLGAVLLQFPYAFKNEAAERGWLGRLREWLPDLPLVVEFRHEGWFREATYAWLRSLGLGFTSVDAPPLRGLPRPVAVATSPIAYIRFHGRNAARWWSHGAAYERYDYLYRAEELEEWLPRVRELAARSDRLFIAFNNHYQGQAVVNARMLARLLGLEPAGERPGEGEPPR